MRSQLDNMNLTKVPRLLAGLQYRLGAHALCRFEVQVVNQRKLLLYKSVHALALTGSVEIDRRCADSRPKRQIRSETGQ